MRRPMQTQAAERAIEYLPKRAEPVSARGRLFPSLRALPQTLHTIFECLFNHELFRIIRLLIFAMLLLKKLKQVRKRGQMCIDGQRSCCSFVTSSPSLFMILSSSPFGRAFTSPRSWRTHIQQFVLHFVRGFP